MIIPHVRPFWFRLFARLDELMLWVRQKVLPVFLWVTVCVTFVYCTIEVLPHAQEALHYLNDGLNFPPWSRAVIGAIILYLIVNRLVPLLYGLAEAAIIWLCLGPSPIGVSLIQLARDDMRRSIEAIQQEMHVIRPIAVLVALVFRLGDSLNMVKRLNLLFGSAQNEMFRKTLALLRDGWREGVQGSVLRDYLMMLGWLHVSSLGQFIEGKVTAANLTYLLGDLRRGQRIAKDARSLAVKQDRLEDVPLYQWLTSYAFSNSKVFLGKFEEAATTLADDWHLRYWPLSRKQRRLLHQRVSTLTTLNPLASVGRHILLASAFAGTSFCEVIPGPHDLKARVPERKWAKAWRKQSLRLGREEQITCDFTRAYFALYCCLVNAVADPLKELSRISDSAPPVSRYAKFGIRGIVHAKRGDYKRALDDLRRADAQSRMSGNRFFEGIFLPMHAAVSMCVSPDHEPEVRRLLRRAKARADLSASEFFWSQIDCAQAVHDSVLGKHGSPRDERVNQLMARARRKSHGFLPLYESMLGWTPAE